MYSQFLSKLKGFNPNKLAIVFNNEKITYADLINHISFLGKKIKKEIPKKSVVVIHGDYSINSIGLFFSLTEMECIVIPILSSNSEEIKNKIRISQANFSIDALSLKVEQTKLGLISNKMYSKLFEVNHPGLILFSSGSTGTPKAMLHDLNNLFSTYIDNKQKSLNFLIFLLFDHIGGLNTMLNILSMGSTMVIPNERTPESVSSSIEKECVHVLPTSPTFLNLMLINQVFDKYSFDSLRLITYGTEPMQERTLLAIKSKLPRVKLLQTFGTSETGIIKTNSKSSESLLVKFNDPDQEIKVVNGELWIKSKTRILGYLNHEDDRLDKDGWFKTGDLVEENGDGYLKIIGRKSQFINVGGEKVMPGEVENVILRDNNVIDCTVFGIPSTVTGQIVGCKVVMDSKKIDAKTLKLQLKSLCKQHLERYKIPVKFIFTDEIEVNSRFKKKIL